MNHSLLLLLLLSAAATLGAQDAPRFRERVDVSRVLIDARAIDGRGRPLIGLGPKDFEVEIDGKPARVESVQWIAGALARRPSEKDPLERFLAGSSEPVEGRLVVFLFQKSLEPGRIGGFMRMLLDLRSFLDGFTGHDRLAVVMFDSRMRLLLDFTSDVQRVRQIFARNVLFDDSEPDRSPESPSLFDGISRSQADRTYSVEGALRVLAAALKPLPGAKTVVFVGHGFGRLGPTGVVMEHDYAGARDALLDARASVFCLDVTNADYHSLEAGLQLVAEDTGGFFQRTHLFGERAIQKLGAALRGHYVLIVEKPEGERGRHSIDVRLRGRKGTVLARNAFVD